jgi:hypothetical protein
MALGHGSRLWHLGAARVVSLLMVRRRASADGSLRPIDDKIAIFTFMAALHNAPIWYSPDGRLSGAEIAERMSDILMYGMMSASATSGGDTKRSPNSERRTRSMAGLITNQLFGFCDHEMAGCGAKAVVEVAPGLVCRFVSKRTLHFRWASFNECRSQWGDIF